MRQRIPFRCTLLFVAALSVASACGADDGVSDAAPDSQPPPPECTCETPACDGVAPDCDVACGCDACEVESEEEWRRRFPTTLDRLQHYASCGAGP